MRTLEKIASESVLSLKDLRRVEEIILAHGNFAPDVVRDAIDWYCARQGIDEYYFQTTPVETIAAHIEGLRAASVVAGMQGDDDRTGIDISTEQATEAVYLIDDQHTKGRDLERRIEARYPLHRLQSYRTPGTAFGVDWLRMYIISKPRLPGGLVCSTDDDIEAIACRSFLETTTRDTYRRYQRAIAKACGWEHPLIEASRKKDTGELRLLIVVNSDSSSRFFSNISDVINSYGLVSNRKYVEQFANGKTTYALYLDWIEDEKLRNRLIENIGLVYAVPENPLSRLFREGLLNAREMVFGVAAWTFAHQFLTEYDEEYLKLADELKDEPELTGLLRNLRTRLAKVSYDEERIWDSLIDHHDCLQAAFRLFNRRFNPVHAGKASQGELEAFQSLCAERLDTETDRHIFEAILQFIEHTRRTNFYKREKISLSFMLDPGFLNRVDYPELPYGIFLVIGSEFRGYHVRFRDIARGGIRLVRSANLQTFMKNADAIFDENYNLALTQQRKNKDIPEGGSKGAILLERDAQDRDESAFKKYIDGLLDLLLGDERIVDHYGDDVILFLGPDEGTAELMEWASVRARERGYPWWRSFSTGKPVGMGGIPHDIYGMTTTSVHEYVLGMLEKTGLKESGVTKVMTGGPDGDLGSNEILISRDTIRAIVDGSGVLCDPEGLDRRELRRLARRRVPVEHFNPERLSPRGYLVRVGDRNVTLPGGQTVTSGLDFRNTFHLHPHFSADLFVPCGGRPASITINNWTELLDEKGRPRIRFVSEGANLFITQEARLRLEEKGVIIYKDASANKGGVTSSSLEVFAGLVLNDREWDELMCEHNGKVPDFRKRYVEEILDLIRTNARLEFEIIWREHERSGLPRTILTDLVSQKINAITDAIMATDLFRDRALFRQVIACCTPLVLSELKTTAQIMNRVPDSYLRAAFAARLASRYVYYHGLEATEMDFYSFVTEADRLV